MTEELINFETAKLAKEKGFDYWCRGGYLQRCKIYKDCYDETFILVRECDYLTKIPLHEPYYDAPPQALIQRWLREKQGINIFMTFKPNIKKWDFMPYFMNMNGKEYAKYDYEYLTKHNDRRYDTYEEALEAGIFEALALIK
jgi:hypothetical protein